jgi:hypothetical protein
MVPPTSNTESDRPGKRRGPWHEGPSWTSKWINNLVRVRCSALMRPKWDRVARIRHVWEANADAAADVASALR